jgi:hypothetical protein
MTASELLPMLSGVRPCGHDKWQARCPAHPDRYPSLSLKQADDRILIYCHAGCTVAEICGAIGVTVTDLFDGSRHRLDPLALRRRRAVHGLESWREAKLRRCAEDLRGRDTIIRHIRAALDNGVLTKDEALLCLSDEYLGYSKLECRFQRLLHDENVLEFWRQSRRLA